MRHSTTTNERTTYDKISTSFSGARSRSYANGDFLQKERAPPRAGAELGRVDLEEARFSLIDQKVKYFLSVPSFVGGSAPNLGLEEALSDQDRVAAHEVLLHRRQVWHRRQLVRDLEKVVQKEQAKTSLYIRARRVRSRLARSLFSLEKDKARARDSTPPNNAGGFEV